MAGFHRRCLARGKKLQVGGTLLCAEQCAVSGSLKGERERYVLKGPRRFWQSCVLLFALFFHMCACGCQRMCRYIRVSKPSNIYLVFCSVCVCVCVATRGDESPLSDNTYQPLSYSHTHAEKP